MFFAWSPMRLERLCDPDHVERRADGARVLHHVGDELAQERLELAVDRRVLADHLRPPY